MVNLRLAARAAAAVGFLSTAVLADVDPIVIKGSKFFYKTNGTEFFIKGVAYQTSVGGNGSTAADTNFVDPLADSTTCKRDLPYLQQLDTNTVRVYAIDTTKSHDDCMSAFADAGIYVIADLSAPNISINRVDPAWNDQLYSRYTNVIDMMSKYSNTLGFFAGNEVANNASNAQALPFVKAAVRDMKAYIQQKNYRDIGVGYAADDGAAIRVPVRDYVNCGDQKDAIDFFGYNIYSWCGPDTGNKYQTSGYADRTAEFANYTVPVFFAEYGCNVPEPRVFDDTKALFSSEMTKVWSGGIVYEYFEETNNYGLVKVSGNTVTKLTDFGNLQKKIGAVDPSGVNMGSYTPTNTVPRQCPPTTDASYWTASSNLPPTPNEQLCSCMVANLTCTAKNGLDEDKFQDLFSAACTSSVGCDGINANGTTGDYGAYSMCSAQEKLSWAFNNYYEQTGQRDTSCDFDGNAQKQSSSVSSQCSGLLSQAGPAGTGTVTSAPSGTGAIGGSSSSGVAGAVTIPSFDFAVAKVGAYVVAAAMAGAGLMVL